MLVQLRLLLVNSNYKAGVRQLAALFIVFKGGSSSGGPGIEV